MYSTATLLFESTDNYNAYKDPENQDWIALVQTIQGERFEALERRYYLALNHLRRQRMRPVLPGQMEYKAQGKQGAFEAVLDSMEQRKKARQKGSSPSVSSVLVETLPRAEDHKDMPAALKDPSIAPPPLRHILGGPGRPPIDGLCMLRAFLAAPLLDVKDCPTDVFRLLHHNPTLAHMCGFLGHEAPKQPGEYTSRQLPSQSACEEFTEVMTRYGLWHEERLQQVRRNLSTGVVEVEDTIAFDTAHVEAYSHCGNVVPKEAQIDDGREGKKPKQRKVPRVYKRCDCGKECWESCEHPWCPTDQGAAVVVKGTSRVYWAHKASVAAYGKSEVPIDARVCQYAAESDGRTLLPHLALLEQELPESLEVLRYIPVDDAYQGHQKEVVRFGKGARLVLPVHPRKAKASLAQRYQGIHRFTPTGVPVCEAGYRFGFQGCDIVGGSYIWRAPDDEKGQSVCVSCPLSDGCLSKGNCRQIRVPRQEQPHINWEHPQHAKREREHYKQRTGVERAIKRIKVDLKGELLTHRDSLRVQAHLDRKLLTLHLLLEIAASP